MTCSPKWVKDCICASILDGGGVPTDAKTLSVAKSLREPGRFLVAIQNAKQFLNLQFPKHGNLCAVTNASGLFAPGL